jgi:hypothetical protein
MRTTLTLITTPVAKRRRTAKKRSHRKQIDRKNRSSAMGKHHMIISGVSISHLPESIVQANGRLQSLLEREDDISLDEVQGAVEYMLDIIKAARGPNG